jgi:hypothetical protein
VKKKRRGSSPEFERTQFGWREVCQSNRKCKKAANHVDEKCVKEMTKNAL